MKKLAYFFVLCISFAACSPKNHSFSDGSKWIPSDFDIHNETLLIERYPGKDRLTEDMDAYLTKHYPGKYVIVSKEEIANKSGKYADLSLYRFAFQWKITERYNFSSGFTDYDPDGKFYDRSTDKLYPTTKRINNYGQRSYIPFINTIVNYCSKTHRSAPQTASK
jgi:hypothetical protein